MSEGIVSEFAVPRSRWRDYWWVPLWMAGIAGVIVWLTAILRFVADFL